MGDRWELYTKSTGFAVVPFVSAIVVIVIPASVFRRPLMRVKVNESLQEGVQVLGRARMDAVAAKIGRSLSNRARGAVVQDECQTDKWPA